MRLWTNYYLFLAASSAPRLATVVVLWLLATVLADRQRRPVTRMVLTVAIVSLSAAVGEKIFSAATVTAFVWSPCFSPTQDCWWGAFRGLRQMSYGISGLLAAAAVYRRFEIPLALALCIVFGLIVATNANSAFSIYVFPARSFIYLIVGVATFLAAVRLDLCGHNENSVRSPNAFWLHLIAAPLLFYWPFLDDFQRYVVRPFWSSYIPGDFNAALMAIVALFFISVAIVLGRRIYAVAAIPYVIQDMAWLVSAMRLGDIDLSVAAVFISTGAFFLVLGVSWRTLRRKLIEMLPSNVVVRLASAG